MQTCRGVVHSDPVYSGQVTSAAPPGAPTVVAWDLGERLIPYQQAWERQRELHEAVRTGAAPNTVLLLEHEFVYTAGRSTKPADLPFDGSPVVDVDRGGRITWHGPGQLVAYPIVRLGEPLDVRKFVCRLEQAIIDTCATLGLTAGRVAGRTGVWVANQRKVAAIGVRVSRGAAMHGLALNCNNDLAAFERIVPCGISDAGVTTLSAELERRVEVREAAPTLTERLQHELAEYA